MSDRVLIFREKGKRDVVVSDDDTELRILDLDEAKDDLVSWVRTNSDVVCLIDGEGIVDPDDLSDKKLRETYHPSYIILRPYEDWCWGGITGDWREIEPEE